MTKQDDFKKAVQTLADGLGVTASDATPKFLEAIGISLGFDQHGDSRSLARSAARIADALERIADHLVSRISG